ncbi:MAG: hypothetical protein Q9M45_13715 [Robiginitomaculum sp.]|nr:hypothetical protein [Robiginitomaculum sp.]
MPGPNVIGPMGKFFNQWDSVLRHGHTAIMLFMPALGATGFKKPLHFFFIIKSSRVQVTRRPTHKHIADIKKKSFIVKALGVSVAHTS